MGDLVLGRLIRDVTLAQAGIGHSETTPRARQWVHFERLAGTLEGLTPEAAEHMGRNLIDHDVRVGPYRFLRSALTLDSIDVVTRAVFRSYFADPQLEVQQQGHSVTFRWVDPPERSPVCWALIDGMVKRLMELGRLETSRWTTEDAEGDRILQAKLSRS